MLWSMYFHLNKLLHNIEQLHGNMVIKQKHQYVTSMWLNKYNLLSKQTTEGDELKIVM